MNTTTDSQTVVLLDTTVQIDRLKIGSRKKRIEQLLSQHGYSVTTSIALLEFKATFVAECIKIHNNLRHHRKFTLVRDMLCEKRHRQAQLRTHIFSNFIGVFGSSFDENLTEEDDAELADKARLALEQKLPRVHRWFINGSVGSVLRDKINCTRAFEEPRKKNVAFDVNLPDCVRGKNKTCKVEECIRALETQYVSELARLAPQSSQIASAAELFQEVLSDAKLELSSNRCRSAGDCLIALEAKDAATHVMTTNATEWQHIAALFGIEFERVDYPDEKTV